MPLANVQAGEFLQLVGRMAAMETKFDGIEIKTDRIEQLLTELVKDQSNIPQSTDDRTEKIINDRLEGIKDALRESKTRIEGLEGSRKYNLVTIASVFGAIFTAFIWFNNQGQEAVKEQIYSQGNVQKAVFDNELNQVKTELAGEIAANKTGIAELITRTEVLDTDNRDYEAFKSLVTQQNYTSIKDRADQERQLTDLATRSVDNTKVIASNDASYTAKLIEIETQFRADAQARNIQFAEQQRQNANIQNSIRDLGGKMPEAAHNPFYFPDISAQRPPQ